MISRFRTAVAPFSVFEGAGIAILLVVLSLLFQHKDLLHTIGCTQTLLEGHLEDFYEINKARFEDINYLLSTYILFALWMLPLKLLGLLPEIHSIAACPRWLLFYSKLLPCLLYVVTMGVMYSIVKLIPGQVDRAGNSKALVAIWATSPLAVYSQFLFGQYDIFTTLLMMLGIRAWLRGQLWWFTGLMAIAVTFKYFPIFVFFPLLMLVEKRLERLAAYTVAFGIPLALAVLPFRHSPAFQSGVLGFQAASRVTSLNLTIGHLSFNLLYIGWFFLCCLAYLQRPRDDRERFQWGLFLSLASLSLIFSLIIWYPQWLIIMTPLVALAIVSHPRANELIVLDFVRNVTFVAVVSILFVNNTDQILLALGGLGHLRPDLVNPDHAATLMSVAGFRPQHILIWHGAFVAITLALAASTWPRREGPETGSTAADPDGLTISEAEPVNIHLLRLRFYAGVGIFVIPALIAFVKTTSG